MNDLITQAYVDWCETGDLKVDKLIIRSMYIRFKMIASETYGIPEYTLMHDHATYTASRLLEILRVREIMKKTEK